MGETTSELRQQIDEQRTMLSQDLDALGDKVSPRRVAERRADAVRGRFSNAKTKIMGTASGDGNGSGPSAMVHSGQEMMHSSQEMAKQQVAGAPLAAGFMAFAAGMVVAALIPETKRETELAQNVQPMAQDMASTVKGAAQESAQKLKPAAQEAVGAVRDKAQDAAGSVKDQAQESSEHVEAASSSASQRT